MEALMPLEDEDVAMEPEYVANHLTRWFLVDFTVAWVEKEGRSGINITWFDGPSEKQVKDFAIAAGLATGDMAFVHCDRRNGEGGYIHP
jgi:hypothetical protein